MKSLRFVPTLVSMAGMACFAAEDVQAAPPSHEPRMSWLDNGKVRVGVDLELGGAITWLSKAGESRNVINSHDWGRQVQMSFYSGPIPFVLGDKHPAKMWETLGWNPIQAGDCAGHRSRVVEQRNDGRSLFVKCVPMQWPMENVPGDCTFETQLELDGSSVRATCRLVNERADHTQYAARDQELPAVYTNGPWHRIFTYTGSEPFTGKPAQEMAGHAPPAWGRWNATEQWAALVDDSGFGLGVLNPGTTRFIGGFSGKPGAGGASDAPCGYLSPVRPEILDHNVEYSFAYTLVMGTVDEIRAVALRSRPADLPRWDFGKNRQGWYYGNASDAGWRSAGGLEMRWESADPQLLSPPFFCRATEARRLVIEAAVTSQDGRGEIFWETAEANGFSGERRLSFPMEGDGKWRSYKIDLGGSPEYQGGITQLRIDPSAQAGGSMRVRSIYFER